MAEMRLTERAFREKCRSCPENAKLFPDEVLFEVLNTDASPRAQDVALAELAVRQTLSQRRYEADDVRARFDVTKILGRRFGAEAYVRFRAACERCAVSTDVAYAVERAFRCLPVDESASDALLALKAAFCPWLEADGVIPVFNVQDAYLLPFSFVPRSNADCPRVLDVVDVEIAAWTKCFKAFAADEGIDKDVRVDVRQTDSADTMETGNSMALPVLMAWWRQKGDVPRYDVLRFVATGAYEGRRLGRVDTKEKEEMIARHVDDGLLIRPGDGRRRGEIPVGVGREELLRHVRALAEENYDCSTKYACDRLLSFDRAVRERQWGDWASLDRRLEHLFACTTEKDAEEYMWGLMLRSAACCHAGQTERAHQLNAEAQKIVARFPEWRSRLLRLQIEELVILQDEEDFEKIYRLAPELGNEIDCFAKAENNSDRAADLQMRYWGTMGQFWLYDSVARQDRALANQALEALERALKFANELYERSKKANDGCAECSAYGNCTQDANYMLLWTAFFNRPELCEAARRAKREADALRKDGVDEKGADKNDAFRWRIMALAQYRAVLEGDANIPATDEDAEIAGMAETEKGWVAATTCKYLGAVAMARDEGTAARKWFERANDKMKAIREEGKYYGLVMRVIHVTVLAEAYRSLRRIDGQEEFARRCRAEALEAFASDDAATWHKDDWKKWLESEGDDVSFPGKFYWY